VARAGDPRAILVIRLSALGDVALSSAVIEPLRQRYPHARIVWVVQPEAAPLILGHESLDAVVTVPRHEWGRLLRRGRWLRLGREFFALVRRLRAERFDLALDLQGLWKSAILARASGAPRRIGVGPREGSGVLLTDAVERTAEPVMPGGEYVPLLTAVGAGPVRPRLGIALTRAARLAATRRLTDAGMNEGFIALCPFTTRPQKHWFPERWAALAARLHEETARPVVLFGGPGDRAAAAAILRAEGGESIHDWTGTTGIGEAAGLLGAATLVVGVDTGLTHIAAGQGRPTIALFGSTRPWRAPPSLPVRVICHDLPCAPCHRHPTCGGAWTCMREIGVSEVLAAAHELLAQPRTEPATGAYRNA
jgi:heptosyltransferase-1